jgi:hypothetical protein
MAGMRTTTHAAAIAAALLLACTATASARGDKMMGRAAGAFDVTVVSQTPAGGEEPAVGRMTIDKQFHGDLEATSKGQMLTGMSAVEGSGAYVAVERVEGTLGGRKGSFLLYHVGTMERGAPSLAIKVVPDSGTRELEGLTGTMTIEIKDGGKHFYAFAYEVPERR